MILRLPTDWSIWWRRRNVTGRRPIIASSSWHEENPTCSTSIVALCINIYGNCLFMCSFALTPFLHDTKIYIFLNCVLLFRIFWILLRLLLDFYSLLFFYSGCSVNNMETVFRRHKWSVYWSSFPWFCVWLWTSFLCLCHLWVRWCLVHTSVKKLVSIVFCAFSARYF